MLKRHLRVSYNMTPDEYRRRWNLPSDYPMVAPTYAKRRSEFAKKIGLGPPPTAWARLPTELDTIYRIRLPTCHKRSGEALGFVMFHHGELRPFSIVSLWKASYVKSQLLMDQKEDTGRHGRRKYS